MLQAIETEALRPGGLQLLANCTRYGVYGKVTGADSGPGDFTEIQTLRAVPSPA